MKDTLLKNVLLLSLLLFALPAGGNEPFYFSNLSLDHGLSQITVTSIHQDRKGFMWFGTRNGLNRYDGYEFDVFLSTLADTLTLSDNHILCISEDATGNLWIGTNDGLNYLDLSTHTFRRYYSDPDNAGALSHNTIYSICPDDRNNVWIGTESGLDFYDAATGTFRRVSIGTLLDKNRVNALKKHQDKLYIGTLQEGLIVYDLKSKAYEVYKDIPGNPRDIGSRVVKAILIDRHENLWIGTLNAGVSRLKRGETRISRYDQQNGLTNNNIRTITEAPDGSVIVGTFNGLNVIDSQTQAIRQYKEYGSNQGGLSHYSITSVCYDNSHTLWVGTYAGGICYYNTYGQKFRFYDMDVNRKKILGIIGPVVETPGSLFIATEGGGLLEMDKRTNTYESYDLFPEGQPAYEYNIIKSLYLDRGRILCGTNVGTIYSFDLKSKRFTLFYDLKEQRSVYYLGRNMNGQLIIGCVSLHGFCLLSGEGEITRTFPVAGAEDAFFSDVRCVLETERDVYLIGTRNDGLFCYDHHTRTLKNYKHDKEKEDAGQIPENYVTDIIRSNRREIWIGTYGGGISRFDARSGTFTTYNAGNNLLNNNVCKIIEDRDKRLWISTITGISEFNRESGTFKNYTHSDGIRINEFTLHAGIRLSNDNLVFSGNNGFVSFNPQKMAVNPFTPPVVLKNLYVNNGLIIPSGADGILKEQLDTQQEVVLKYDQSNIAIEYTALNYLFSNRNYYYTYQLEGFDKEWNHAGNRRMAYYTNIPPGDYRFVVKGSNNDGVWSGEEASVRLKILPPFWKTGWAYLLYALLFAVIVWFVFSYFNEKKRLKDDIRMKQMEGKAREEFHQARSKLFTHFSHELRTPLTLIISPLDDLAATESLSSKARESVRLMQSNARRLLRIVNNLMDFQKQESGTMKLNVSESDFVAFTAEMVLFFKETALSRKIRFAYRHPPASIPYCFDKHLMEKVFFNFLSNAFKNVPDGGTVEVNLETRPLTELTELYPEKVTGYADRDISYIVLEIKDSGKGIAADELEQIFVPFYQVAQNEHSASGTGLGLSLSKSIVEMHHGVLWAESPGGSGAVFRCILPAAQACPRESGSIEETMESDDSRYIPETGGTKERKESGGKKPYTILVVEDHREVRNYIISHLKDTYHIIEAGNGSEAIEKTLNHFPDLIISDLMMPGMDGMEMCSAIKNDIRVSHIPIILVTARTMASDITEGYQAGADDYITKPFSSSVLVARVENIINSRNKLKKLYGKDFSLETLGVKAVSLDEQFMQKLYRILEANVSNPDLNLDQFCREIGMSRANLYRKIKSITDLSPNEFVRNFRLTMGAKMLRETQLPVSDVYVAVGFNSHGYFSNSFKAYFGVSPSEYVRQQSELPGHPELTE